MLSVQMVMMDFRWIMISGTDDFEAQETPRVGGVVGICCRQVTVLVLRLAVLDLETEAKPRYESGGVAYHGQCCTWMPILFL